jgi:uncharacterized membrane protein YeaQ/YmgE (transglycosylase-associated protein family)
MAGDLLPRQSGNAPMWNFVGMDYLNTTEQVLVLLIACVGSLLVGWVMNLIMEKIGFGIFGNTFAALLGVYSALYIYNRYVGTMKNPEAVMLLSTIVGSVMLHIVFLSLMRRVLRL